MSQKYFLNVVVLITADSVTDAVLQGNEVVNYDHINAGGMKNAHIMQVNIQPENKQVKQ